MTREKQTTKDWYRHTAIGEIFILQKHRDGVLIGGCPATKPLRDLDSYKHTPTNNLWIRDNKR